MAHAFNIGDHVEWNTSQGKTIGKIKQKLTKPTHVKGHPVAASEEAPQYLVVSDKSSEEAAHHPDALKKID